MPYWKCYYHLVWSTKNREALILPEYESTLFEIVRSKGTELGSMVYAVNGTENHIHIAAAISPGISIGQWIGQVKGTLSHHINSAYKDSPSKFRWQESYGVLTFGEKNLTFIVD